MEDKKIPQLSLALQAAEVATIFKGTPELCARWPMHDLERVTVTALKHKQGKHCVLQYDLLFKRSETGPVSVIGKIFRKDRAEKNYHAMKQLEAASARQGAALSLGMAAPLAYVASLGMLLQSRVPGQPMAAIANEQMFENALQLVAINLALLHGLRGVSVEACTLTGHIQKFVRAADWPLLAHVQVLEKAVRRLGSRLEARQPALCGPLCPAHGDLNPRQVFVDGVRAYFIDFDGLCIAPPALDVGNFMVALQEYDPARGATHAALFLKAYLRYRGEDTLAELDTYAALTYLRRAMICLRQQKTPDWPDQVGRLLSKAESALRGEAMKQAS